MSNSKTLHHDSFLSIGDKVGGNPPPQAEFPKFDGLNPKLWRNASKIYFRVYAVSPDFWVEHATMHCIGNAALWFQSAEEKMGNISWESLYDMTTKHFDHGQYELLYRQVFKVKHTSTVTEYIERFDTLMHHMLAYKLDLDPTLFTTRFIDGLHKELCVTVLIQMPNDLETIVYLALLHEKIGEDNSPDVASHRSGANCRSNFQEKFSGHSPSTTRLGNYHSLKIKEVQTAIAILVPLRNSLP
jgi:hypothetical protein